MESKGQNERIHRLMSRSSRVAVLAVLFISGAAALGQRAETPSGRNSAPNVATDRTELQEDFLKLRFGLFIHFNMATYINREWANGYEDPALFKPDKLNCRQWANVAHAAGIKYAVLTVKHTGGWCLWDSHHTNHDVADFRNYKNGKGDIVREFVDAFRAHGLKVGFYYCFPGDFSNPLHSSAVPEGKPDLHGLPPEAAGDYVGFIKKQLTELLTDYGPIDLLWIDQYRNRYTFSRWQEIRMHVRSLQPRCLVIGNNAHDLSESDVYGCELPWSPKGMPPEGNTMPAEVCDKISRTWFWNTADGPEHTKDARQIVEMLKLCNERNANYLLNVPPDRDGLISGVHLKRMQEVATLLNATGATENPRMVPVANGWAKNSVNAVVFRRNSVVTHEDTQYVAFYDEDANVVLAKRTLGTDLRHRALDPVKSPPHSCAESRPEGQ
ncbi:MAG: alpha-L-fucosidase [Planctomycetota bacterium]